jgi:protocatechuate 3,4-dioxygenase beta subunit
MNTTGETFSDVQGKYQILGLEPGRYELQIVPSTGYEAIFSKGGHNLAHQPVGSGSLEGAPHSDQIISIRGYAEDLISELDFGLDNKQLTNVYTTIKLAGATDEVVVDVAYGNTTAIPAQSTVLKVQLDPNVTYLGASHPAVVYHASGHALTLNLATLTTKDQHFSVRVEIDPTKLTGDTIRYHSFNFVSTISTTTLPEITNLDNVDSIDQRIITVGDIYGKVYHDKDNLLGRNPNSDKNLSEYPVLLKNADGNVIASTTTNAAGAYVFLNVKPGTYTIEAPETGDYHSFGAFVGTLTGTALSTGTVASASVITLNVEADTIYADYDFSVITLPSVLKGTIKLTNALPLQSIEVVLKDATKKMVKKVYSDTSGAYEFTDVDAGTYSISYTVPTTYQADSANVGTL